MTGFNSSSDSGFPSAYDHYSTGSETTAKNRLQTPAGFNTSAPSAVLNKHQDGQSTIPIGVPGTSYSPHDTDQIFSTVGGHYIIFGNSPGSETLRIQSKAGAAIELGDDGSIKLVSAKGLHMSINGDNQIVLQGDYAITTSGSMKFKASSIVFDTNELITNVHGDMTTYVDGDYNEEIMGDKHTHVVTDMSNMVGGNRRETVAGQVRDQVLGNRKLETGGDCDNLISGYYQVSSIGQMLHLTNNNSINSVLGSYSLTSKGNTSISSQSLLDLTSASNLGIGSKSIINITADTGMNIQSKAATTLYSDTGIIVNSKASIQMTSSNNISVDATKYVYLTGGTNIDGSAARIDWNTNSRSPASAANSAAAPGVGVPAPATYPQLPDLNLMLDSISDYVATNGQMDNIVTAEQVLLLYGESNPGDHAAAVPQEILDRLAEKGIEYPPPAVGKAITTINTDVITSNITDTQSGWNPGVV